VKGGANIMNKDNILVVVCEDIAENIDKNFCLTAYGASCCDDKDEFLEWSEENEIDIYDNNFSSKQEIYLAGVKVKDFVDRINTKLWLGLDSNKLNLKELKDTLNYCIDNFLRKEQGVSVIKVKPSKYLIDNNIFPNCVNFIYEIHINDSYSLVLEIPKDKVEDLNKHMFY
jgi:hypothetical protein